MNDRERVQAYSLFRRWEPDAPRTFVKGLFEETAPAVLSEAGQVVLAHIDCDIYSAVKYSYDTSKPFMVSGGYFVFDDATVSSCLGATEAVADSAQQEVLRADIPQFVFRHVV